VRDHVEIGAHSVVGAGSVVTGSVPERVMVFGNPARIIKRNVQGM
jgi:acetyltransferase-like isoleucine patch superfamily enzyme